MCVIWDLIVDNNDIIYCNMEPQSINKSYVIHIYSIYLITCYFSGILLISITKWNSFPNNVLKLKTIYLSDTKDKVILFQHQLKISICNFTVILACTLCKVLYFEQKRLYYYGMEQYRVRRHNIEDMKEMKRLCKIIVPNNSEIHSPRIRKCLFLDR